MQRNMDYKKAMKHYVIMGTLFAIISTTEATSSRTTYSISPSTGSATATRCPRPCQCNLKTMTVECAYQNLYRVPHGLPKWTRSLILTGNKIAFLPNKIFRRLIHLEDLEVDGNEIEMVSDRVLRKLRKLRKLNLSSNKIEYIPPQSLNKLGKLEILLINNNKLGKLPVSVFSGLASVNEIDLSNNLLQTLEVEIFETLPKLKELYFHGNRWHCDCQLKNVELSLRGRNIRTGYMVCDSPSALAKQHLRDVPSSSSCGPNTQRLIGILIGVFSGLVTVLFAIFMCRRRTAKGIEMSEMANPEMKSPEKNCADTQADNCSRSSIISVESSQSEVFTTTDLLNSPSEILVDVLNPSPAYEAPGATSSDSDSVITVTESDPPPYECEEDGSTCEVIDEK